MLDIIRGIVKCQKGATAVEYGLIVSLIVIAMLVSLNSMATSTQNMWNKVSRNMANSTQ